MLESFCALTLTIDLSNARDESTPEDRYDARTCLLGLARAHQDRFLRLECIDDVKLQLEYATYALALLPAHAGAALLFIGSSLREIFDRFRDPSEIESSITILDYAIHLTQEDPQYCAMASFERARTQRVQHIHLGSAPLDVAITLMQEALQITPSHHPDRPVMLHHLAFLHHYQWEHSRQTEDAEAMLHLMEKALGICPMKHPFRSNILRGTAIAVFSQFTRSGILADLERSLGLLYEALTSLPCQPHPSRPRIYTDLANELRTRFEICGHEADIDDAIANGREAIGAFSSPVANLSCAVNLSTALGHRFDYKANIEDLEESVQLLRQTINTVPQGHPYRYLVASNLGGSLITRFEQFYSVADLNEGISLLREADRLQPPGYRHRGFTQFNLANALSLRFQSSASLNDLDEAIAIHDIWLTNVYHRSKLALEDYRFLQDVATLRRIRYEHHKELDDLALAIKYQEECVRIQPDANAEKGNMLSDLAKVYQMRSEHLNSVEDAQRAFSLQEQALSCTSLGRSRILFSMSKMYLNPTLPTKSTKKALHLYHNAIGDPHCVAQVRLLDGLQILPHLENAVQLEESGSTLHKDLLRAYRSTVHLLPRIAYFGLDVNSRLNALARAPVLATQAAAYATHIPDLEAAIEILEEGRAVFWAQCARLRSSFDQLPGELADELTKAARELELGARSVTAPSRADHEAMSLHEEQLAQRRRLSEHFEGLIAQARSLPGLDRFLLNDTFATFSMAAQKNPVVIFLATSNYCGALLLRDSTSRVEELKLGNKADFGWLKTVGHDVNKTRIATRSILQGRGMKRLDKAQANPLHVIWHEIVKPVVQALGYKVRPAYPGIHYFLANQAHRKQTVVVARGSLYVPPVSLLTFHFTLRQLSKKAARTILFHLILQLWALSSTHINHILRFIGLMYELCLRRFQSRSSGRHCLTPLQKSSCLRIPFHRTQLQMCFRRPDQ